jgi:membrane protease subunit HflK
MSSLRVFFSSYLGRLVLAGLVLVLGLYLLTGVVEVRRGELAVVRRFGRVLEHRPEPGLWIGLPWGMDRVDRVVVDRVRSVSVGYQEEQEAETIPAGQVLTGDHNLVNAQVVLFYKVDPRQVVEFVLQADRVEELLARAVETALAEWVAGRTVDDVLLNGNNSLRPALLSLVAEQIEPYRLGVELLDARVKQISPPAEVKDDFDAVARAQTQIVTQRNRAEQDSAVRLSAAQAERYRMQEETAGYVRNRKLLARQEAERFLVRLRQYQEGSKNNPNYLRQIWEEERGKLLARMKQNGQIDLLDHHLGNDGLDLFTVPSLPGRP